MATYRVLVVDDSVFMRRIISDLISEDTQFLVIDTAKNGKEAVEKVKLLKPDAVTMDIEMPEMNGLEALQRIMAEYPTPVVMLSSLTLEGAAETIKALELGAVDFVRKPSGSVSLDLFKVKHLLLEKLRIAVRTKVKSAFSRPIIQAPIPPPKRAERSQEQPQLRQFKPARPSEDRPELASSGHIVAIGTSTGGPRALNSVLKQLPAAFPAPILIVQHMPPNFTRSLANRLNDVSEIQVIEAEDGMKVLCGTAYVAPGGWHMKLQKDPLQGYRIKLTKEDPRSGHRPSVDTLFESLVPYNELKRHAVLMTGMGKDGALGMLALLESGAVTTIAESEETCIVYGMPRAAVLMNAATHVLPQDEIPEKIIQAVQDKQ